MRILDDDTDKSIESVTLLLTIAEAKELLDSLEQMIANPTKHQHAHVPDGEFKREVTVALYEEGKTDGFDARTKRLIRDGR